MSNRKLKILIWNSRGIRNKLIEFFDYLIRNDIDIALVNETWLKSDITMNHPNFYCYRRDRTFNRGGGVAIVVNKNICHTLLPKVDCTLIENIGVKITLHDNSTINVFSCYFPGGSAGPSDIRKRTFKEDLRRLSRIQGNYILGGDFNCRNREWGCLRSNCWGNILLDLLATNTFGLIYPPEPTLVPTNNKVNPSTIDFFITNVPEKLSAALTQNNLGSDHLPVLTTFNSVYMPTNNVKYDYKNADWKAFKNYINRNIALYLEFPLNSTEDINKLVDLFTTLILNALERCVPKIKSSPNYIKRLTRNILNLITMRNKSRRNWIRYRLPHFKMEMGFLNKVISYAIVRFRNSNWNRTLKRLSKASSTFWNISKILKKKKKTIPCFKVNNRIYTTNSEKVELLGQKFHSNYSISANLSDQQTFELVSEITNALDNEQQHTAQIVSIETVKSIIKSLKNKKSYGSDKVSNRCLKALPPNGLKLLTNIFNACIKYCYFPISWRQSKIIAIPKPGKDASDPDSYRPISLLSTMSKILEKIIKEKVISYINDNNILPIQQFGFRSEHNTVQPLIRIKNIVKNGFTVGKSTAMVLLDVKSAFDSVWHKALLYKLVKIGLDIPTIKIIKSFLSNRTFRVHIGHDVSNIFTVPAGCPQGSCLSPILYNIYTHDFPQLNGCESSIFADDTAILSSNIYSHDVLLNLQNSLDDVINYFNKWKILVNPTKTQAIYFTRKRKHCFLPSSNITINGIIVPWETKVKYLGVMLDKKMLFNEHVGYTLNKLNITTKMLYPFINRKSLLSIENKLIIFKVIFQSIILYGAPLWHDVSNCHLKRLQISQNKILKMMGNLSYRFSTSRLHSQYKLSLVKDKIDTINEKFIDKCSYSSYDHIRSLCL